MKKIILITLGIVVGLGIIILILYFTLPSILSLVAGKDEKLADDSELIPSVVSYTEPGNAYDLLHSIDFKDIGDFTPLNKWLNYAYPEHRTPIDWGQASTILEKNQTQINQYNQAAKQKYYQSRLTADPSKFHYNGELEAYSQIRNAGKLAALNAFQLAEQGKMELAIDQIINIYNVGYMIQRSNSKLLSHLVGISQSDLALNSFKEISQKYTLPPGQKNYVIKYLNNHKDTSTGLKSTVQYEYLTGKQGIEDIISGKFDEAYEDAPEEELSEEFKFHQKYKTNKFYFKPNKTLNEIMPHFANQLNYIDKPCEYKNTYIPFNPAKPASIFTENYVGKALNSLWLSTLDLTFTKPCEMEKSIKEILNS